MSTVLPSDAADRRFVRQAMSTPMLARDHEAMLAARWRDQGDERALHELTGAYMRLVISMASRFRRYGLPMADLVQEGNVGLMQAAARFEPSREVRFSTYATWWIRSAIQDYILRNWSIVRTGTTASQKTLFFNLRRLRARLNEFGERLSPEARAVIATELDVDVAEVERMEARLFASDRSLNAPAGEAADIEWQDMLTDESATPDVEAMADRDAERRMNWLREALKELSDRERVIIQERRLVEEGVTLETLGQRLGVSKERVRQIEHQALRKLRNALTRIVGDPDAAGLIPTG